MSDTIAPTKYATLTERTGCCWPIGDRDFLFCNEAVDPKSKNSWCPKHHKLGTTSPTPKVTKGWR